MRVDRQRFLFLAASLSACTGARVELDGPIAVAAPMHLHAFQKLPLENYPNLQAWMSRVEALPCWQKSDPAPHIPPALLAKLAA